MPENVEKKLREWLEERGFPLEMRVAAAFRRSGLDVRQGDYYNDPREPLTRREIDVVVGARSRGVDDVLVELAVECKTSSEPWVVFSKAPPQGFEGWPGKAVLASEKAHAVKWGGATFIAASPRVGYAVRPAFRKHNDKDFAYEAMTQAVSYGEFVTASTYRLPDGQRPGRRVVLPCVVFGGDLFEAFLGPECDLQTAPVERIVMEWRQAASPVGFVAVPVVSAKKLDEFAAAAAAWVRDVAARLTYNE